MAVLDIAQIGNPVLREATRELDEQELATLQIQKFIDDLIETMRAAKGAGLAANQVHHSLRICAIEISKNPRYPYKPEYPLTILVNPKIEVLSEVRFANYEGCLSVPNLRGVVSRPVEVRVCALDRHGAVWDKTLRGLTACTFQHEVDHLDGQLFVDRVEDTKSLCTWDEFEAHQKDAFVRRVETLRQRYPD